MTSSAVYSKSHDNNVFSKEDKILINSLNETKGYGAAGACKLLKEFPQKN